VKIPNAVSSNAIPIFWRLNLPAKKYFASINLITGLHILKLNVLGAKYCTFTHLLNCSLYTVSGFALRTVSQITHGLRSLPLPHAFYKLVVVQELIVALYHNLVGIIHALIKPHLCVHQSNCVSTNNVCFSAIATYLFSCSFTYLRVRYFVAAMHA